jgi:hypothetical protein
MLSFQEFNEAAETGMIENLFKNELKGYDYVVKQSARATVITVTVDNRNDAREKIGAVLKKRKMKFEIKSSSKSSFDPIFIDSTTIIFKPKKTGSDAKTTAMQENVSAWIFRRVLNDNMTYKSPRDIVEDPRFKKEVLDSKTGIYPTVDDEWIQGFYAQQKKMLEEFSNNKFTEFNRDGGFMDWISKLVKDMGIKQKDTWNPADIWLVNNESSVRKEIVDALGKVKIVTELNAIMRRLYNERRLVGVSLKKISGKVARWEEINIVEVFGLNADYGFNLDWSASRLTLVVDKTGKFGTQDLSIVAKSKKAEVKFQIKQNDSNKLTNLKWEPTQKGAGSARLGKVPVDMLSTLMSQYSMKYVNDHKGYPKDVDSWEKAAKKYVAKFNTINKVVSTGVSKPEEFVNNMTQAFMSDDKKYRFTATSKLMQIDFLIAFLKLNKKDREEVITDMVFLAMKKGKQFGPHGKLY